MKRRHISPTDAGKAAPIVESQEEDGNVAEEIVGIMENAFGGEQAERGS